MKKVRPLVLVVIAAGLVSLVDRRTATVVSAHLMAQRADPIPRIEVDPAWPKPLPKNWAFGEIGGVTVDSTDHIWVASRPGMVSVEDTFAALTPPQAECCRPAPPVLEFDQAGNLVQAWGPIHDREGKQVFEQTGGTYTGMDWPTQEHGIFVDHRDNVWVGGSGQILKFTRSGKFLLQIGGRAESKSNNDTKNLAGVAGLRVEKKSNELYVADGYRNRRVIVFDAETGDYKRHWGAYGRRPPDMPLGSRPLEGEYNPDGPPSQHFATVHCVAVSKDDLVYVCDRSNNRIQVFRIDGTYVKEAFIAPRTLAVMGAAHDIGFSADPEQRFLYVADGANKKVWIVRRGDLTVVGSFGGGGFLAGQLAITHTLAVDSKGNIYVGESRGGTRVQRFKFMGLAPSPRP